MSGVPRILLLSAASLVGQNVLASLSSRRQAVRLIAANSVADEPPLFDFDAAYLTPSIREHRDAFAARFDEIVSHCQPDLIIPCRDDDVSFLAGARDRRLEWASRLLCGASAVASAMLDKIESAQFCRRHGLPFAPSTDAQSGFEAMRRFAAEHGYPLVAKPRRGYASHGVRLILDDAQLKEICAEPDYMLQKYLGDSAAVHTFVGELAARGVPLFHTFEETKTSVQAGIAPDGTVSGVFVSGNVMRAGRSERVAEIRDEESHTLGQRWAEVFSRAGWRGPLNIQCQRGPDGALVIYELNGRFTGATHARYLLGFDEVGLSLRDWLGLPAPPPSIKGRSVVRFPIGRMADPRDVQRLQNDGFWLARPS